MEHSIMSRTSMRSAVSSPANPENKPWSDSVASPADLGVIVRCNLGLPWGAEWGRRKGASIFATWVTTSFSPRAASRDVAKGSYFNGYRDNDETQKYRSWEEFLFLFVMVLVIELIALAVAFILVQVLLISSSSLCFLELILELVKN